MKKRHSVIIFFVILTLFSFGSSELIFGQTLKVFKHKAKKPDLAVTSLTAYYGTLAVNQQNKFTATIKNIGSKKSPPCQKMIQRGGAKAYSPLQALDPGQSITVTFYASFSKPQNYVVTIMADGKNIVKEINEKNNKRSIRFAVKDAGKPDLFINSMSFNNTVTQGNYVNLTFQVMNKPGGNVAPASKCIIKIGGETYGKEYNIPVLNPGKGHTFSRGWTPTKTGSFVIKAIADSGNAVNEKDENNIRTKTVKVIKDENFPREDRKLEINGKLAIRMYSETNIRREESFYLYFNGTPANNLIIKVDNHLLKKRPGVPGGYNNMPWSPYSIKSKVNVIFKKMLSSSPLTYQTLASATGTINRPVNIIFPPKGFKLDIDSANNLTISWSASSDRFGLVIKEVIVSNNSTSQKNIHSVNNISGNSVSVPVSVFKRGTKYVFSLQQYMTNLKLKGNYTANSRITNMIFQFREFETK